MMNKTLKGLAIAILMIAVVISTHVWTMRNLSIETDGDGDSAFVTVAGHDWFYGINGHEPCQGEYCCNGCCM